MNSFILWLIRILNTWYQSRITLSDLPNKNKYVDLSPFDNADKNGKYSEALEYAIRNSKVKNIAVSGAFGSGKSSFLRTFEKNHSEWEYLNISLATFKESDEFDQDYEVDDDGNQKVESVDSKLIEKSILQQIFYKVEQDKIPRSQFKRIQIISFGKLLLQALAFSLWIFSALTIFKENIIKQLLFFNDINVLKFINYEELKELYSYGLILIFISLTAYFLFTFYNYISNMQLSKLNLMKGEAELTEIDKKSSMLNENIDEILYFFESTNFNVVVIEDLDRFKNIDIFIKLREINDLINNYGKISQPVVFIYAVRDDMFKDIGRTKFFEFIIPIIPYINKSNSYEKLLEKFGKSVEKEFLNDMSIYIDDMRLLNNIYNEFKVYENKIENINDQTKLTKLLAMIIYKNLYPADFSDLHKNEGVLATVIQNKKKYLNNAASGLNEEIVLVENEISDIEKQKEWLNDKTELKSLYVFEVVKKLGQNLRIDDHNLSILNTNIDQVFDRIKNSKQISNQHNHTPITFVEIENLIDPKYSYLQREEMIDGETKFKIQKLKSKIEKLKQKKVEISRYSLSELLFLEATTESFDKDIGNYNILKYMLQYGYINEDFYIYISRFFPGSITEQDHEFLMNVKGQSAPNYEHNLQEVSGLMEKLRNKEFEHHSILNYDLIDFLIENIGIYPEQLKRLLLQLSNQSEESLKFIDSYLEFTQFRKTFIHQLVKNWDEFWIYLDKNSEFSESKKDVYLLLILESSTVDEIVKLNKDHSLEIYIDKKPNFIEFVSNIELKKVQELLSAFDTEFESLNDLGADTDLLLSNFIYENNYYAINESNIDEIIEFKVSPSKDLVKIFKTAHYSTLKKSGLTELVSYINEDINDYIESVFIKIESNTEETEETVIELLNNENINKEHKLKIINKQTAKLSNITSIEDKELWSDLFENNRVYPDWDNILHYFENNQEDVDSLKIDRSLANFVNNNKNSKELSLHKIDNEEEFSEELNRDLRRQILLTDLIEDESYKDIVKCVRPWPNLNVSSLSSSKIEILLSNNILMLTQENIENLIESETGKEVSLIQDKIEEFIENQSSFTISKKTYAKLIDSSELEVDEKSNIINNIDFSLMDEEVLSTSIRNFVFQNNYELPTGLLNKILAFDIKNQDEITIFSNQIKYLNKDEITEYLDKFGGKFSEIEQEGYKPIYLDENKTNLNLVKELDSVGFISSFSVSAWKGIKINTKHPKPKETEG